MFARQWLMPIVAGAVLLAIGCSDADDASTAEVTEAPTTTESATLRLPGDDVPGGAGAAATEQAARSTTTSQPVADTPVATTATTATTLPASTTTTIALPQPISPPDDPNTTEPEVELGSLAIPIIGVEASMFEGIRTSTLDLGPGHWPGSAMPGEVGNVVIAGHRVSSHAVFRNLDELEPGDEIVFGASPGEPPDARHVYVVRSIEIVTPDALWIVEQTPARTATLFACHPAGSTSHRIVVHAELVE